MMAVLAVIRTGLAGKARPAMNRDMVKPMPATRPTAQKWRIVNPSGRDAFFKDTNTQTARPIPKGLPRTSPAKIPRPGADNRPDKPLRSRRIPALAKAKMGMMRKAETGVKACSARSSRPSRPSFPGTAGMAKPVRTPAMVGWMPP